MSKRRRNHAQAAARRPQTPPTVETPQKESPPKPDNSNLTRHSRFLAWFIPIALVVLFLGRWIIAINGAYFGTFVELDANLPQAMSNMRGLTFTEEETAQALPLQQEWDLFTSSRLRDDVTITAQDGTNLHGYYYDENSDVTVVFLPRFGQDGTADFLPGTWFYEQTGCNILIPDVRCHGESGGSYFSYGFFEQYDLADWINWAEETQGAEKIILWGEGTGANTILYAASNNLLPDSVSYAVAESPYGSLHQLASRSLWRWYTIPAFPFLYSLEFKLAHSDAGFTAKDTNLTRQLTGTQPELPVLFLQSTDDDYILPEWTEEAYDAYASEKEMVIGGSTHGTVYPIYQEKVTEKLTQWNELYLK